MRLKPDETFLEFCLRALGAAVVLAFILMGIFYFATHFVLDAFHD